MTESKTTNDLVSRIVSAISMGFLALNIVISIAAFSVSIAIRSLHQ